MPRCWRRCGRASPTDKPLRWTPRLHAARLRLFRSQHPYRERRRLHRMPRPDRRHAADLEGDDALHELVSLAATAIRRRICARATRCSTRIGSAPPTRRPAKQLMAAYHIHPKTLQRLRRVPPMTRRPARNYWRTLEELADTPDSPRSSNARCRASATCSTRLDRRRFLQIDGGVDGAGRRCRAADPSPTRGSCCPMSSSRRELVPATLALLRDRATGAAMPTGVLVTHQMGAAGQDRGQSRPSGEPRRGQRDHAGEHPDALRSAPRAVDRRQRPDRRPGSDLSPRCSSAAAGLLATRRRRAAAADRHGDLADPRRADRRSAAAIPGDALASTGSRSIATTNAAPQQALRPAARSRVRSRRRRRSIFGVESDLISTAPGPLAYARQFAARGARTRPAARMSRVYAIESTPTLLGAKADHRLRDAPGRDRARAALHRRRGRRRARANGRKSEDRHARLAGRRGRGSAQHRGRAWSMPAASSRSKCICWPMRSTARSALSAATIRLIEPVAVSPIRSGNRCRARRRHGRPARSTRC